MNLGPWTSHSRRSNRRDLRRQEQVPPPSLPKWEWNRQQGTLLAQVLLFGVMVQVVLAVIFLHSIPPHGEDRSATIGPLIESASPGLPVHHPITGLVRSYPNGDHHDPTQRRNSITFTTMPNEIPRLQIIVRAILEFMTADPENTFDAIHLCIPDRPMRSQDTYPSTLDLQAMFTDPRIIIHRLFDYGPMTRYLGPLAYEMHPESAIVMFDIDSNDLAYDLDEDADKYHTRDIIHLVHASRHLDESAIWCNQGENFVMNEFQEVKPDWGIFPVIAEGRYSWNLVHFCRGVGGLLFKPKQFVDFWWNQSEYHESCFWDSYQMERQGFPLKVIHVPKTTPIESSVMASSSGAAAANNEKSSHRRLGSLTDVNKFLQSDQTCPVAWLTKHPDTYPTARVKSGKPWVSKTQKTLSLEEMLKATSELIGSNSSRQLHDLERAHRYQGMHERAEQKLNATTSGRSASSSKENFSEQKQWTMASEISGFGSTYNSTSTL
jgi:hypothetical protein